MLNKYPRWLVISVAVGLLAVVSTLGYLTFGRSKINAANFEKIGPDMSLVEVEALLGKGELVEKPGGDINGLSGINQMVPKEHKGKPINVYRWQSGNNVAYVHFVGDNCEKNIFKTGRFP